MKKTFLAIVLFGMASVVAAKITLDSAKVQTFQVGGTTVESLDQAAIRSIRFDFQANAVEVIYGFGSTQTGSFQFSPRSQDLIVRVDGITGVVAFSDGRTNRQLTPAQAAALEVKLKDIRNVLEQFGVEQQAVTGTHIAW